MPASSAQPLLMAIGVILAATFFHWLLWRLGRRLPLALARWKHRGRELPPAAHLVWHRPVALALLPLKIVLWLGAAWVVSESVETFRSWRGELWRLLTWSFAQPLFEVQEKSFSAGDLLLLPLAIAALWLVVAALTGLVRRWVLRSTRLDVGAQEGISTILRYALLLLGLLVVFQVWGIDASTLAIVGSVLGVGIGFGLQNIVNNFVSGLILGLERPIKPGDFVEVGQLSGTVERVGARSTTVETQDRVSILVPNSRFLESEVINWSYGDPLCRLRIPAPAAYGSPAAKVRRVLLEVAAQHPEVLAEPGPEVQLTGFGSDSLLFELLVWTRNPRGQTQLKSDLNFAIDAAYRKAGLSMPFPQRDLHLRSSHLDRLAFAWAKREFPEESWPEVEPAAVGASDDEETREGCWTLPELEALVARMRAPGGLEIADRRHLLNLYPRCFVGREAVAWLVREQALSRAEALKVGKLLVERGLLRHVLDEHGFEDAAYFYRFSSDEPGR